MFATSALSLVAMDAVLPKTVAAEVVAAEAAPAASTWVVTDVVDGDTIDVLQGDRVERVRVIGIDTPERGQCGVGEASDALAEHILGERVAPPVLVGDSGPFQSCDAVRAAGRAPILMGEPGFEPKFDGNDDGLGCE